MKPVLLYLLVVHAKVIFASTISDSAWSEGHAIKKRFADNFHEFEGHDIAHVLHENLDNSFHHITRRDLSSVARFPRDTAHGQSVRIKLALSSGSDLHLSLRKRSIVDGDTQFSTHTEHGVVKRDVPTDCYATGVREGDENSVVGVSMCDGLHGVVTSNDREYYIHPLQQEDEHHQVHVLWRKAEKERGDFVQNDVYEQSIQEHLRKKRDAPSDAWKTSDSFVIEMALFSDAHYWERLQGIVPGREDEYLLITMAAVQALYGDREKVGYDMSIKVKSLQHWQTDPEGYDFQQSLGNNLGEFCRLTRDDYPYDMLFLHTGVTQQGGPAVGMAYVNGVCKKARCANLLSIKPGRHPLAAHEIGHNLGFAHHGVAKCPDEVKSLAGGFMGGGDLINFSPCNKIELKRLFETGGGSCLFEETGEVKVPASYVDRPKVFPGQSKAPDDLCRLYFGDDYTYFRPYPLSGVSECFLFWCLNSNNQSFAYHNVREMSAPSGFPCGDEMFCRAKECRPWNEPNIGWDVEYLRSKKKYPQWTNWSDGWGECSRQCGTGVQLKQRHCAFSEGANLAPYCSGLYFEAKLCNQAPCGKDDPTTVDDIRKARGDEMCSKFHDNGFKLETKDDAEYSSLSKKFVSRSTEGSFIPSKSCILSCQRSPDSNANVDGILPDGTPCLEATRTEYNLQRFGIEMRCAQGVCMEFSNCTDNEPKDACGICGEDELRCVSESFTDDVIQGERVVLATIPAGSTGVNIEVTKKGGRLEVWGPDGTVIIGKGGQYKKGKYIDGKAVAYADTQWSYVNNGYVRAKGPLNTDVVIKVYHDNKPVEKVDINYLLPLFD